MESQGLFPLLQEKVRPTSWHTWGSFSHSSLLFFFPFLCPKAWINNSGESQLALGALSKAGTCKSALFQLFS